MLRLNKFIANNFPQFSRRQADSLIAKSLVKVNDKIAKIGQMIDPETDQIQVFIKSKWQNLKPAKSQSSIIFYKPIFCLTSRFDPSKKKTVYDFLPPKFKNLKPAGRLDYMSEGLLVLSSDGDLIQNLTHPKNRTIKKYLVNLNHQLTHQNIRQMQAGLELENYTLNPMFAYPAPNLKKYDYLKTHKQKSGNWYIFELSEGRNNQIRKVVSGFGLKVRRLIRVQHGEYALTPDLYQSKFLEI